MGKLIKNLNNVLFILNNLKINFINLLRLIAGLPPQMPIYNSWLDCWSHLSATNQLKRGNSLLWRYYTGPQVIINGKPIPINKYNFHLQSTT